MGERYWSMRFLTLSTLLALLLTACSVPSRLHGFYVPGASLRMVEVTALASRDEIINRLDLSETMRLSGIDPSELVDDSLGQGMVFCCNRPFDDDGSIWFFVPKHVQIEVGDIVEIRSGPVVMKGEPTKGPPNTATRVRQRPSDPQKQCRWTPENPRLWARVLYCDWMQAEGWVQQDGLWDVWIKHP
jgi:hypothetical protein